MLAPVLFKVCQVGPESLFDRDEEVHRVVAIHAKVLKETVRGTEPFTRKAAFLSKKVNDLCFQVAGHPVMFIDRRFVSNVGVPPWIQPVAATQA